MKADINLDKVHPQLSYNIHSVDGVLLGAGSGWAPGRLGTMYLKKSTNYSVKLNFVVLSLHLVHILTKVAEGEGGRQLSKKLPRWLTLQLFRG
jgi:hypothetical protein